MDEVNFWVALRSARCGVDVVTAEVATELQGFFDGEVCKVLVSECYDLLLGDEEGQLVFTSIVELAELDTVDFGADDGGQIIDLGIFEEVGE